MRESVSLVPDLSDSGYGAESRLSKRGWDTCVERHYSSSRTMFRVEQVNDVSTVKIGAICGRGMDRAKGQFLASDVAVDSVPMGKHRILVGS